MSPLEIETARNALLVLVTGLLRSAQPPLGTTSGLSPRPAGGFEHA
ncbi:hypothetical protein ABZZ74_49570 [Streptomyces sp. NPDC006476]